VDYTFKLPRSYPKHNNNSILASNTWIWILQSLWSLLINKLLGSFIVPSLRGVKFFLLIINCYSRFTWVFMMKGKSKSFEKCKYNRLLMLNQTEKMDKCLWTNNDLKLCSKEFDKFSRDKDIMRHLTICHTPHKNIVIERINKTFKRIKSVLSHSSLDKCYYCEALSTTCYLKNCSPSTAIKWRTLVEHWLGSWWSNECWRSLVVEPAIM